MQSKTRASDSSVTCLFTGAHVSLCPCIGLTTVKDGQSDYSCFLPMIDVDLAMTKCILLYFYDI